MSESFLKFIDFTKKKYAEKNNILGVFLLEQLSCNIKLNYPETIDSILSAIKDNEETTISYDIWKYLYNNITFQNKLLEEKIEENNKLLRDIKESKIEFPTETEWNTNPKPFLPPIPTELSIEDSEQLNKIYEKCKYCYEKKDFIGVYLLNKTINNIFNYYIKDNKLHISDIIIIDTIKYSINHPLSEIECFESDNKKYINSKM